MQLLLDTCTFLWLNTGAQALSSVARDACLNPDNELYLSAITAWEIAIKHALGKLDLPEPPAHYVRSRRDVNGIVSLPLDENSAVRAALLPRLHTDPFDRGLICQAIEHGLDILTPDEAIRQYGIRTLW